MKLIRVTYRGATNTRGARMFATDGDGRTVTTPYRYGLNDLDRATFAAQAWCDKHCPAFRPVYVGGFEGEGDFFRMEYHSPE